MGIGIKDGDWTYIVHKNRLEDEKRVKDGNLPRFPQPEFFTGGKITTTEAGDKWIKAHCLKRDENGKLIPITARGRRRRERLGK